MQHIGCELSRVRQHLRVCQGKPGIELDALLSMSAEGTSLNPEAVVFIPMRTQVEADPTSMPAQSPARADGFREYDVNTSSRFMFFPYAPFAVVGKLRQKSWT